MSQHLARLISTRLKLPEHQVHAALLLFDEGATVPFVARYRKERTGGLDEVALRDVLQGREVLVELAARRETIIAAMREQGNLTEELAERIAQCKFRAELEDLYAPYKQRRKTRGVRSRQSPQAGGNGKRVAAARRLLSDAVG